jgi:hypothetical protein
LAKTNDVQVDINEVANLRVVAEKRVVFNRLTVLPIDELVKISSVIGSGGRSYTKREKRNVRTGEKEKQSCK